MTKKLEAYSDDTKQNAVDSAGLRKKILIRFLAAPIVLGLFLFVPAGTFDYWQAWVYCAVLFIPMFFLIAYFLTKDPKVLERRIKMKEKENRQKSLVMLSGIVFFISILLPGLDRRFGWSAVPFEIAIAADVVIFLGYLLFFLVLRENHYASRVIEIQTGQKVISTGPYSIVRHPMYVAVLLIWLFTPVALGSYWALVPFLSLPLVLFFRILNEEDVLKREFPGYAEYCQRTKYRLVPFVW